MGAGAKHRLVFVGHRTLLDAPAVPLTGRIERSAGTVNLAVRRTHALNIATSDTDRWKDTPPGIRAGQHAWH